jgi:hypothetical protein
VDGRYCDTDLGGDGLAGTVELGGFAQQGERAHVVAGGELDLSQQGQRHRLVPAVVVLSGEAQAVDEQFPRAVAIAQVERCGARPGQVPGQVEHVTAVAVQRQRVLE